MDKNKAIRKVFWATVDVLQRIEVLYQVHDVLALLPHEVQRLELVTDEDGWPTGLWMYPEPETEDDHTALEQAQLQCDLQLWQGVFGHDISEALWMRNPPEQLVRDGVKRLLTSLLEVLPYLDAQLQSELVAGCLTDYPHLFMGHTG